LTSKSRLPITFLLVLPWLLLAGHATAGEMIVWQCPDEQYSKTIEDPPPPRQHLRVQLAGRVLIGGTPEEDNGASGGTLSTITAGLELDYRRYRASGFTFAGRLLLGGDFPEVRPQGLGAVERETGFGLAAEPAAGFHWHAYEIERTQGATGSFIKGTRMCDGEFEVHTGRVHFLGVRPLVWITNHGITAAGAHLSWEYDYHRVARDKKLTMTGRTVSHGSPELGVQTAVKVGFLHTGRHGNGLGANLELAGQLGGLTAGTEVGLYFGEATFGITRLFVGWAFH